jgi:hypothetical protein
VRTQVGSLLTVELRKKSWWYKVKYEGISITKIRAHEVRVKAKLHFAKNQCKNQSEGLYIFLKAPGQIGGDNKATSTYTMKWNFWEVFTDDLNSLLRTYFLELSNEVQIWTQIVDCRFQGYGVPCYLLPHKSQVLDMWWISFMFKLVRQWERWQEIGSEIVQPWQQFETNLSVFLVSERSQIGIEMYNIPFSHQLDNKVLGHKINQLDVYWTLYRTYAHGIHLLGLGGALPSCCLLAVPKLTRLCIPKGLCGNTSKAWLGTNMWPRIGDFYSLGHFSYKFIMHLNCLTMLHSFQHFFAWRKALLEIGFSNFGISS